MFGLEGCELVFEGRQGRVEGREEVDVVLVFAGDSLSGNVGFVFARELGRGGEGGGALVGP